MEAARRPGLAELSASTKAKDLMTVGASPRRSLPRHEPHARSGKASNQVGDLGHTATRDSARAAYARPKCAFTAGPNAKYYFADSPSIPQSIEYVPNTIFEPRTSAASFGTD